MKNIVLSFGFLAFVPVALAENIQVTVNGMVCSFCAQGISKTFKKEAAVKEVKVDLEKKIVTLETKGKDDLSDKAITERIKDSGYEVVSIKRGP